MNDDGPPIGPHPTRSLPSLAKNVTFDVSPVMSTMPVPAVLTTWTTLPAFLPM